MGDDVLSEAEISHLINQSGRLRMLSHRTGMFVTLLNHGDNSDKWFADELEITANKFVTGMETIEREVARDESLKQQFYTFYHTRTDGKDAVSEVVKQYQKQLINLRQQLHRNQPIELGALESWLKYISHDLLISLNNLVGFFDQTLQHLAESKAKKVGALTSQIESSLDEIDQINLSVKILSFNASVEAARAGEAGRGFAVVSKEMTELSVGTRKVTSDIKSKIQGFISTLND
jgi:hypothetical protein